MAPGPAMDLGAGRIRRVRPRHQRLVDRHPDFPWRPVRQVGRSDGSGQRPNADCRRHRLFQLQADGPLHASLDWRRSEGEEWTITIETSDGRTVRLEDGGASLLLDGKAQSDSGPGEYPDIYRTFADLIDERRSLVDVAPFRLVADCLLVGKQFHRRARNELMEQLGRGTRSARRALSVRDLRSCPTNSAGPTKPLQATACSRPLQPTPGN